MNFGDRTTDRVVNDIPISLRGALVMLIAIGNCSTVYYTFVYWLVENKFPISAKMKWPMWENLFSTFMKSHFPIMRDDLDLIVKARKIGHDALKLKS